MKVDFTEETVFSFDGPNLCLLGNEADFLNLAKSISDLTAIGMEASISLADFNFMRNEGNKNKILFASKEGSKKLGVFTEDKTLLFQLDARYWERIFKYFIFMSWQKCTYYLNSYEDALRDLDLEQECNFICSSEF